MYLVSTTTKVEVCFELTKVMMRFFFHLHKLTSQLTLFMKFAAVLPHFLQLAVLTACTTPSVNNSDTTVQLHLTTPDGSVLVEQQDSTLTFSNISPSQVTVEVDTSQVFQIIDGFGYTLTGGSAILINQMADADKIALLNELFTTEDGGIGVSYLRISLGASDLSDHVFSYNDLPEGQTDTSMQHFTIEEEQKDLLPVLKEILAISPELKIMASPWSPPVWMKTNGSSKGGSLKPEFYDAYARYFVRYIEAMAAEGVKIHAVTIQNEPLHPGNNPSLYMLPEEQASFIKNSLGPAFARAGIDTKILVYDHNADRPDYPIAVMDDPGANKFIYGSAFHLYGGEIEALDSVHNAHPDKHIYFTEQWVGAPGNFAGDFGWHIKNLVIGASRHWSRTVLEWNLAADSNQNPHTEGGCTQCLGAVTIDNGKVTARNPAYYIIAQIARFVPPGSVRIASTLPGTLHNVAFKTPAGRLALIVQNEGDTPQPFSIACGGQNLTTALPAGAVGTYVW